MKTTSILKTCSVTPLLPAAQGLVSDCELETLRSALAQGLVPRDLEYKLAALDVEDVVQNCLRQKTLLFLALLAAGRDGVFRDVTVSQQQRLLRVIAYVRKADDAINDDREGGYHDDLQLVRAVSRELAELLDGFTNWRLQHQVPDLWRRAA